MHSRCGPSQQQVLCLYQYQVQRTWYVPVQYLVLVPGTHCRYATVLPVIFYVQLYLARSECEIHVLSYCVYSYRYGTKYQVAGSGTCTVDDGGRSHGPRSSLVAKTLRWCVLRAAVVAIAPIHRYIPVLQRLDCNH